MNPTTEALRKEKFKKLTQSLFEAPDNQLVDLPDVKEVDAYHARYGGYSQVDRQAASRPVTQQNGQHKIFYNQNRLSEDFTRESDDALGPSLSASRQSTATVKNSSRISTASTEPTERSTTRRSSKTATKQRPPPQTASGNRHTTSSTPAASFTRSSKLLDEELESITSKAARVLELKSSVRQDLDDDNILLNVEERQNTLGRASLLHQNKTDNLLAEEQELIRNSARLAPLPKVTKKAKQKNSDGLLEDELDLLNQSLSAARFTHLRNLKLQRIKDEEKSDQYNELSVVKDLQRKKSEERKDSNISRKSSLETFKGLEATKYNDLPSNVYDDLPSNIYDDMPEAFSDIPSDVFDNIPRAVTARNRSRVARRKAELNISDHTQDMLSLQQQQLTLATKPVEQGHSRPSLDREVAVRDRNPQENNHHQQPRQHPEGGREIGLIAFLFQGSPLIAGDTLRARGRISTNNQVESDFMFALFIQEQEQQLGKASQAKAKDKKEEGEKEEEFGHFCAPHCPGFCQANQCIFHST